MSFEQRLERITKVSASLTELAKFTGFAALVLVGAWAILFPAQLRLRLLELGLQIQQIDAFGVKLVQAQGFDIANSLIDAQMGIEAAAARLSSMDKLPKTNQKEAEVALNESRKNILITLTALDKQEKALKETKAKSGITDPSLPATGWIFAGRLSPKDGFIAGPRIDSKNTVVTNDDVTKLVIKYDAPVVDNGDECVRTDLKDFRPPSPNSVQMLLRADQSSELKVLGTAGCPSIDGGKWIYAQIQVPPERVRFAKFSEWK